jgi:hypothetical protein
MPDSSNARWHCAVTLPLPLLVGLLLVGLLVGLPLGLVALDDERTSTFIADRTSSSSPGFPVVRRGGGRHA